MHMHMHMHMHMCMHMCMYLTLSSRVTRGVALEYLRAG